MKNQSILFVLCIILYFRSFAFSQNVNLENSDIIMYEGFEGEFPTAKWSMWNLGGAGWGVTNYIAHEGSSSVWCARSGYRGCEDPTYCNYPTDYSTYMTYGPFTLENIASGEFSFYVKMNTEEDYDTFFYGVSINGNNFRGARISGDTYSWQKKYITFNEKEAGNDSVWIAFIFKSDLTTTDKGVFIDDIYIKRTDLINVKSFEKAIRSKYQLSQNYPNPFNSSTTICFSFSRSEYVTLKIFNLKGQEIETLINGYQLEGEYKISWLALDVPSGIYFYRLQIGGYIETKKLVLQK